MSDVWHQALSPVNLLVNLFSLLYVTFIIPHHTIVAGYYGFTLDIRVSVRLSVVHLSVVRPSIHFSFPDDNLSKHQ